MSSGSAVPVTSYKQLISNQQLSEAFVNANMPGSDTELDFLGEVVNLAGRYKRGVRTSDIEGLHPEYLSNTERQLAAIHRCEQTDFLHIGRACYLRVPAVEARLAREDRLVDYEKLSSLVITEKDKRPLLHDAIILPGLSSQRLGFQLAVEAGIPFGRVEITDFANTEMKVSVGDSVRGKRVFIVDDFGYDVPRHLQTLKLIMNAVTLAGASEINLVLPSFPFARQDRKPSHLRAPISAEVVAADLVAEGMSRLITLEIHAGQIVGFFRKKPVDNLLAIPLTTRDAIKAHSNEKLVLVYADLGMDKRAEEDRHLSIVKMQMNRKFPILQINKKRVDGEDNKVKSVQILGDLSQLKDATAILMDDMVDTAGTTVKGGEELKRAGARLVVATAAHPVFSLDGVEKIKNSRLRVDGKIVRAVDELYITDSTRHIKSGRCAETGQRVVHTTSCAPLLGEAVRRLAENNGNSLRELLESPVFYL